MKTNYARFLKRTTAFVPATLLATVVSYANPLDGQVVAGNATITTPTPTTELINQQTNSAIINWQSFNIGTGETTQFIVPDYTGVTLNRVVGSQDPSKILGTLKSNGTVMVVNPDGILFGPHSIVDVGGLLATTSDIEDKDFMAKNYQFTKSGKSTASIVNQGMITVKDEGIAALVAPGVRNEGVITAKLGKVTLGAANKFTLDFYGDDLISLMLNDTLEGDVISTATGKPLSDKVANTGKISADGGTVVLKAATARKVVNSVINNSGVIEANSVGVKNGKIVLSAATADTKSANSPIQTVQLSGTLSAQGKAKGEKGGKIYVTGEAILAKGAKVNANGLAGGGTIALGGDYRGHRATQAEIDSFGIAYEKTLLSNSSFVSLDSMTTLAADATDNGNGGKVVVWSDTATYTSASISARGGAESGNGGFVETSGKLLGVKGAADASAVNGKAGTWLLDPLDIYIDNSASSLNVSTFIDNQILGGLSGYTAVPTSPVMSAVAIDDIASALDAGVNVQITTRGTSGTQPGNIYFAGNLQKLLGAEASLVLNSANDIYFNPGSIIYADPSAGPLNLYLEATNGKISAPSMGTVWLNGGTLELAASDGATFKTSTWMGGTLNVVATPTDANSPSIVNFDVAFENDVIKFSHDHTTATIASNGVKLTDPNGGGVTNLVFKNLNLALSDYAITASGNHGYYFNIDSGYAFGAVASQALNGKPEIVVPDGTTFTNPTSFGAPGIAPVLEIKSLDPPNCKGLYCVATGPEGKARINTYLHPVPVIMAKIDTSTSGSTPTLPPIDNDYVRADINASDLWTKQLEKPEAASALLTYAFLSDAIYSDTIEVDGWKRVKTWDAILREGFAAKGIVDNVKLDAVILTLKLAGFDASMYKKDGKYALAFRGTDLSLKDVGGSLADVSSDVLQYFGSHTLNQYDYALIISNFASLQFGSSNITLTGHSLGGGLAQYVASQNQSLKAVTFNSAGINLNKNIPTDLSNVVNVRLTGDPVSSRLNQLGHTKYEFSNEGNLLPHGIAVVISSLKNSIRIAKPKAIVFQ